MLMAFINNIKSNIVSVKFLSSLLFNKSKTTDSFTFLLAVVSINKKGLKQNFLPITFYNYIVTVLQDSLN